MLVRWLLLAVAAIFVAVAWWLPADVEVAPPLLVALAVVLAWIVTRPWHPVVAPLYRRRLRSAWEAWTEALDRWYARGGAKGAYEAQRATDDLVVRLESLRPPAGERAEHAALLASTARYAEALRTWQAAPDDPAASARLQAAHDALDPTR